MTDNTPNPVDWRRLHPRIAWNRCNRRLWTGATGSTLNFSREERRKTRHVLLYVWAGRGVRGTPGGGVPVSPGACHWSRPGWSYVCRQTSPEPLGITAVHFDLVNPDGRIVAPGSTLLPPEVLIVNAPRLIHEVTLFIADLAMQIRSGAEAEGHLRHAAEALLNGILLQIPLSGTADGPQSIMWQEVTKWIHDNLNTPLPVEGMAKRWGYSRFHFTRLFTRQFGIAPRDYIANARLSLAKELLRETALPIGQIASLTGFAGLGQFSAWFRGRFGRPPTAYREMAQMSDRDRQISTG